MSIAAPFSGGHLNPAVTISLSLVNKNDQKKWYFIGQLIGAVIGASLGIYPINLKHMAFSE